MPTVFLFFTCIILPRCCTSQNDSDKNCRIQLFLCTTTLCPSVFPVATLKPFSETVHTSRSTKMSKHPPAIYTPVKLIRSNSLGRRGTKENVSSPSGKIPKTPSVITRTNNALSPERCRLSPSGYASTAYGTWSQTSLLWQ